MNLTLITFISIHVYTIPTSAHFPIVRDHVTEKLWWLQGDSIQYIFSQKALFLGSLFDRWTRQYLSVCNFKTREKLVLYCVLLHFKSTNYEYGKQLNRETTRVSVKQKIHSSISLMNWRTKGNLLKNVLQKIVIISLAFFLTLTPGLTATFNEKGVYCPLHIRFLKYC